MEGIERVTRTSLVRRSKLFVPVNREKFVAKAWTRGADCIILDLEDAVAPNDKAAARKMVKDVHPPRQPRRGGNFRSGSTGTSSGRISMRSSSPA